MTGTMESTQIEIMAERADRSMRTYAARATAERVYTALASAMGDEQSLLAALGNAHSWSRVDESRFTCAFGNRSVTITIPTPFNAHALLRVVVRTEVNVALGDSDEALLMSLHAIAQRELQQLLDSHR
jgi:hypothetical protein